MVKKYGSPIHYLTTKPTAHLTVIVGVSGLIYLLVFTLRFPLATYYATIPPIDYTKLTNYSRGGLLAYVIGIVLLFWLYFQAIWLAAPTHEREAETTEQPRIPFSWVIGGSAGLAVISIFAYPLTAIDLFIYAIRTRGWALYDLNPLATAPIALPASDPWLRLAAEWIDAASPYGPVWEYLSLLAFDLSGGNFLPHLMALKILAALAFLGSSREVYLILRYLRPEWASTGTIIFAWSPLVLLESVQNGHNDIIMVFLMLIAVRLFVRWQTGTGPGLTPILVCVMLALSILVKFMTVLIVPFFLLALVSRRPGWLHRLGWLAGYGLFILMIVVAAMAPYWPGWQNWAVLAAAGQAGRSLLALLILGLRERVGTNTAFDLSRSLLLGLYGLIYLYLLGQTIKRLGWFTSPAKAPSNEPVSLLPIGSSFYVFFWYVLLVAPVFHAWYLLWFLPLAAILAPFRPRPLMGAYIFSITALLIIPYFETIRVWVPILLENQFLGHLVGVPLLIIPPALALLWPIHRKKIQLQESG